MFHVYPRADMEGVLSGALHPGDAMPLADAQALAARLCGRSVADVQRIATAGRIRPRIFLARGSRGGVIIARADDPKRRPHNRGTLSMFDDEHRPLTNPA